MTDRKAWEGHTPGPWRAKGTNILAGHEFVGSVRNFGLLRAIEADAALIAAAPSLAARVEELEAERDRLRKALERIACRHVTEGPLWWQVAARAAMKGEGE